MSFIADLKQRELNSIFAVGDEISKADDPRINAFCKKGGLPSTDDAVAMP